MKSLSLLLASTLSTLLLAAEPDNPDTGSGAEPFCYHAEDSYSPGAIIKQGDSLYRCIAAYDADLQRIFVWVHIPDATQDGREISIYWR